METETESMGEAETAPVRQKQNSRPEPPTRRCWRLREGFGIRMAETKEKQAAWSSHPGWNVSGRRRRLRPEQVGGTSRFNTLEELVEKELAQGHPSFRSCPIQGHCKGHA